MTEAVEFTGRRVLQLDLADPLSPIERAETPGGPPFRAAYVLVRLHDQPLGIIDAAIPEAGLPPAAVLGLVEAELGSTVAAHLAADGLPGPASVAGVGRPADVACLASRRALLGDGPPATVVVPVADRPAHLDACLRDLRAQDYPDFEIIVVDNAPARSGARPIVDRHLREAHATGRPGVTLRYLVEPRRGSSMARNRGLQIVSTDVTAFVDADVRVDRHWLTELIRPIVADARTACATGLILPLELRTPAQWLTVEWGGYDKGFRPRLFDLAEHRDPGPLYPYQVGLFGSGGSMAFRTSVLRNLGGFDLALGPGTPTEGGEDLAALLDVVLGGGRLAYAPDAIVWHPDPADQAALRRKLESYGVGLTAVIVRTAVVHPGSGRAIVARVPAAIRYFFSGRSEHDRQRPRRVPRSIRLVELRGMARGPIAYLRSRRDLGRAGDQSRGSPDGRPA